MDIAQVEAPLRVREPYRSDSNLVSMAFIATAGSRSFNRSLASPIETGRTRVNELIVHSLPTQHSWVRAGRRLSIIVMESMVDHSTCRVVLEGLVYYYASLFCPRYSTGSSRITGYGSGTPLLGPQN